MLGNPQNTRLACYLVATTLLIFLYCQLRNTHYRLHTTSPFDGRVTTPKLSKDDLMLAVTKVARGDDFDDTSIQELCEAQRWDDTVVFSCHNLIGGIGNIRQEILHCIRYAIDAGAGIIIPVINKRSDNKLSNLTSGTASMNYLFDEERFLSRIQNACPQMPIHRDVNDLKLLGPVEKTEVFNVEKLPHWPLIPASTRARVEELKGREGQITLVPFERVWRYYRICYDSVDVANSFGNLLPLREDVYRLAAIILYELSSKYDFPIDQFYNTAKPALNSFLGVHLRTSNDMLPFWLTYEDQVAYYLSRICSSSAISSLPVIYVASGNATSIRKFSEELQKMPSPKSVLTKRDILSGDTLQELDNLTWDQQALVDLLVLSRGAYFIGMADSSFAWLISHGRRRFSSGGTCQISKGFWKSKIWGTAFRDEYSDLMGNHGYGWEDHMWP
ncbi:hypothetical protein BJ878DRAFT_526763 [Calycina marina]|uniref:Alternative oxidase n=1 Tax=Calycina marina TaxID=1763456 RepID=A0A9P7YUQ4_9HELO|nr:hypothetical protein BJ878DRAFT_526763 [Calycina marina]